MKQGWTYKKLGDLYPIVMGKTPPRGISRFWDTKKETHNLWVSIADLSKNEGKEIKDTKEYISNEAIGNITKIAKGSLLVSFKLTLGKMAFAGDDLYTNEAIMSLGKRDDIFLKFLYYYFSSLDWGKIAGGSEKVKGKTLNKKSLSEIPIAYISLSEQQRIVERLDSAFAHIDELKANAEKQVNEARALFQKALSKAIEPKQGWTYKKLGEVCEILDSRRKPITKNKREIGSIPYYGATGLLDYVKDYIFDEKLVLLGEDGAKWGAGDNSSYIIEGKSWVNNHAHALRPKRNLLLDELLVYYLNFTNLLPYITGVTVPKLNQEKMRSIEIPVPSLPEQQRIVERLDSLSKNVKALEENQRKVMAECDALKQALLRKVFE